MPRVGWVWTSGVVAEAIRDYGLRSKIWNLRHSDDTGEWTPNMIGEGPISPIGYPYVPMERANNYVWDTVLQAWVPSEFF